MRWLLLSDCFPLNTEISCSSFFFFFPSLPLFLPLSLIHQSLPSSSLLLFLPSFLHSLWASWLFSAMVQHRFLNHACYHNWTWGPKKSNSKSFSHMQWPNINPKSNTHEFRLFPAVLSYAALWDFILSTQHLGLGAACPHSVQCQWISLRKIRSHSTSDVSLSLSRILAHHSQYRHVIPLTSAHTSWTFCSSLAFFCCFVLFQQ